VTGRTPTPEPADRDTGAAAEPGAAMPEPAAGAPAEPAGADRDASGSTEADARRTAEPVADATGPETAGPDGGADPDEAAGPDGGVDPDEAAGPDGGVDPDEAAGPDGGVDPDEAAGPDGGAAVPVWRRVVRALTHPRLTGANAIIALLVGLLGFALIAQVKSNANESTLANDRPDDLVRILSDLDSRKDRLGNEIATLQETVRQLTSGAAGRQAALDAAARRADELGILAGTLPAQGPGLQITLQPQAGQQMDASVVLNAVEELRGAGAEAMQITGTGGPGVRVVASTSFVDGDGGVTMGDQTLGGSLVISVIGDPQTMQTAMSIPGGVVDTVRGAGGTVLIDQPAVVRVTLLHQSGPLRYAHPVS
jgi:uncharacterized protein YlxW (UPF0749 family)